MINGRKIGEKFIGNPKNNLSGIIVGNMVVKRYLYTKRIGKSSYPSFYECLCKCGKTKILSSYAIRTGKQKTCGCRTNLESRSGNKNQNWKGFGEIPGKIWTGLKLDAIRTNKEFSIDIQYLWELFLKQERKCALTGVDLVFPSRARSRTVECTASLDRIDSKKGYIKNNVQWVHKRINKIKINLPQEEFIYWCKLVSDYDNESRQRSNKKIKENSKRD